MTIVLDWQLEALDDLIRRTVAALAAGQYVVVPSQTGYCAAVSGLASHQFQKNSGEWFIGLRNAEQALDWFPGLNSLGRRLIRRSWPGPLTLQVASGQDGGLFERLPLPAQHLVRTDNGIALRASGHEAIQALLRYFPGPLLLRDCVTDDGTIASKPDDVVRLLPAAPALVIDDGPSQFQRPPTLVRLHGSTFTLVREGVFNADALKRLSAAVLLFVCTGNTCRSPLAEALCKRLLAEQLGCSVEELAARGFVVLSAGMAATIGADAAYEAVSVAREHGADLSKHQSRPLSAALLEHADAVFVMTRGHLRALQQQFPRSGPEPRLLSSAGVDLADPFGADEVVYRDCARRIRACLEDLLAEFQRT